MHKYIHTTYYIQHTTHTHIQTIYVYVFPAVRTPGGSFLKYQGGKAGIGLNRNLFINFFKKNKVGEESFV